MTVIAITHPVSSSNMWHHLGPRCGVINQYNDQSVSQVNLCSKSCSLRWRIACVGKCLRLYVVNWANKDGRTNLLLGAVHGGNVIVVLTLAPPSASVHCLTSVSACCNILDGASVKNPLGLNNNRKCAIN